MNGKLARALVQQGIIRQGSILEAYRSAKGLSGVCDSHKLMEFKVVGAKASDGVVTFEAIGTTDQLQYRVPCEFVQTLDGMRIKRVAASHRLTEDGNAISSHKRGRKNENA